MGSHTNLFSVCCISIFLLLSGQSGMTTVARLQRDQLKDFKPTKLFVFGDSYVDTGNREVVEPYGMTFPGYPNGRFSDGIVLTDLIAKHLELKSPLPYKNWTQHPLPQDLKYGMNFAVGGTGVIETILENQTMTTQIDSFQQLIKDNVYNASDLKNSMAYVSVAGNDYLYYLRINGKNPAIVFFIPKVVDQISQNLIRIQELGVKKIVVGDLPALDCIPAIANSSSVVPHCNDIVKSLVDIHNQKLNQTVAKLNTGEKDPVLILGLDESFKSVIYNSSKYNIQNPLTPCCVGVSGGNYNCGEVDDNGEKKYKVCDEPKSAFYWDGGHPSQAGWYAVYNELQRNGALQAFYETNGHTSY